MAKFLNGQRRQGAGSLFSSVFTVLAIFMLRPKLVHALLCREIEDAVNQPADLLIRAEACDLCRIVLRQLAVSELFEGSAEADRG
jgi:hypothetical protein